ncbi:hypothetical protein [Nonomuraea guangzhouensis]|uniref:Poly(3-hydroxyalkanoate) polymerase subunit PhaE n=1 Tax=Nonomuraea guangzhouensis TaxID=1291555 RepID=A0ABW4GXF5_9ACTN|nr:hypothetical protein [Nonomuraea guangzhouensis]
MSRSSSGRDSSEESDAWAGDSLNRIEMVQSFTGQLRQHLSAYAAFVGAMRRDAEAMWKANPPEEYGTFEAWWRHQQVAGPFAEIQEHIEAAAKLTFKLEARYRRNRHEIPDRRQAAAEAKEQAALTRGDNPAIGPPPRQQGRAAPRTQPEQEASFMDMVQRGNKRRSA